MPSPYFPQFSNETRDSGLTPRAKLTCVTPLRELSLNSQKNIMELHKAGLPSVFDRPNETGTCVPTDITLRTFGEISPRDPLNCARNFS